jgi:hypothetical protein
MTRSDAFSTGYYRGPVGVEAILGHNRTSLGAVMVY